MSGKWGFQTFLRGKEVPNNVYMVIEIFLNNKLLRLKVSNRVFRMHLRFKRINLRIGKYGKSKLNSEEGKIAGSKPRPQLR